MKKSFLGNVLRWEDYTHSRFTTFRYMHDARTDARHQSHVVEMKLQREQVAWTIDVQAVTVL